MQSSTGSLILGVYSCLCNISAFLQDESRILRVKVIGGIGLAKKDILGARSVLQILHHENDTIT